MLVNHLNITTAKPHIGIIVAFLALRILYFMGIYWNKTFFKASRQPKHFFTQSSATCPCTKYLNTSDQVHNFNIYSCFPTDECGIVAQISEPLATADIPAYYISTFKFDHALVSFLFNKSTCTRNCLLPKRLRLTAAVLPPRFLRRTSRAWLEPWGPMRAQDSEGVPHPCNRFDFLCRTLTSAKSFQDCFCGRGIRRGTDAGGGIFSIAVSIERSWHNFLSIFCLPAKTAHVQADPHSTRQGPWIQRFSCSLFPLIQPLLHVLFAMATEPA